MEKEVIRVWFCNRRQKEKRINPCSAAPMLPSPGKPASYSPHLVPEPWGAQSSAASLPRSRHLCEAQPAWLPTVPRAEAGSGPWGEPSHPGTPSFQGTVVLGGGYKHPHIPTLPDSYPRTLSHRDRDQVGDAGTSPHRFTTTRTQAGALQPWVCTQTRLGLPDHRS